MISNYILIDINKTLRVHSTTFCNFAAVSTSFLLNMVVTFHMILTIDSFILIIFPFTRKVLSTKTALSALAICNIILLLFS